MSGLDGALLILRISRNKGRGLFSEGELGEGQGESGEAGTNKEIALHGVILGGMHLGTGAILGVGPTPKNRQAGESQLLLAQQ
ncbi:hypothetical protein [Metapseudomonas otitidis]|uniref:hypothetical protein n=1 Tax=Metapseudomonas otitidis TaxID=319939 RepID=UPI0013F6142A|nr:hypothetical protein [Pseudomonas otitidis]